jgi:hypothetical protein
MKTELKKDRIYLTENTPYMEYSETEIKMLDVGEALLISEPKIKFAVPIKVTHYPDYLDKHRKVNYGLPDSAKLAEAMKEIRRKGLNLHSVSLVRHGVMLLDANFYPYDGKSVHDQASVTKSIMRP